jgi:hypothetical protein
VQSLVVLGIVLAAFVLSPVRGYAPSVVALLTAGRVIRRESAAGAGGPRRPRRIGKSLSGLESTRVVARRRGAIDATRRRSHPFVVRVLMKALSAPDLGRSWVPN